MKRRSRAAGEPVKGRRRKTPESKRRNAPKAIAHSNSSTDGQATDALIRELTEALEQQAATSDVLKAISRSAFDLQNVLDTLVKAVARLCGADKSVIMQRDGEVFRTLAYFGFSPQVVKYGAEHPLPGDRASATGRAALEGRAIHIPDVLADPEYRAAGHQQAAGYRTALAVPLLRDETTIGVFGLLRDEMNPFTDKQIALVQNFASQAVIAIENARLLNELRQRTTDLTERTADLTEALEQQTATSEVLQAISGFSGVLEPVFATMLENAVRICDAKFGNIYRRDGDALHIVASHNTPPAFAENRRHSPYRPYSKSPIGRMMADKTVVHISDVTVEEVYLAQHDPVAVSAVALGGIRTLLGVPLLNKDEMIGAFFLSRQEVRAFTEKQIALVKNFAAQAVVAIENTRLLNELRQRTNDLTEALEQQTGTSEVLKTVSASPGDLQPVFASMLENAVRICDATFGVLPLYEGEHFRVVAMHNAPFAYAELRRRQPVFRTERMMRLATSKQAFQVADLLADDYRDDFLTRRRLSS